MDDKPIDKVATVAIEPPNAAEQRASQTESSPPAEEVGPSESASVSADVSAAISALPGPAESEPALDVAAESMPKSAEAAVPVDAPATAPECVSTPTAPPSVPPSTFEGAFRHISRGIVELVRTLAAEPTERHPSDPDSASGTQLKDAEVWLKSPFAVVDHADWAEAVRLWRAHGKQLIAALPARPCPACKSMDHRFLFESYDGYPFHACAACGCWFVPRVVDGYLFEKFFQLHPAARRLSERILEQRETPERARQDRLRIGGYLQELAPFLREKTYLDVGCGCGHSLVAARELGFDACGIEVEEVSVRLARAQGLRVFEPEVLLPHGEIHLLSFWETLEHVASPRRAIAAVLPALAEGGLIALTVPNLDSPPVRFLREECLWVHGGVHCPGHINLFHAPAIERMLGSLGLTVLDVDAQFSLNRLEMLLYFMGRHSGALAYLSSFELPYQIPPEALTADNMLGPACILLERALLLAPILRVVACRREDAAELAGVQSALREARLASLRRRAGEIAGDAPPA